MKKIPHSFGTWFNPMTMETFVEIDEVAEVLAKNWGDIPKRLNNKRAYEMHLLARAYQALQKRIAMFEKERMST